jgi:hypothetical protein
LSREGFSVFLSQLFGDPLLQHLQDRRRGGFPWFADQEMYVFWHDHVAYKKKFIFGAHPRKLLDEQISGAHRFQKWQPAVATERNKMKMALAIDAF